MSRRAKTERQGGQKKVAEEPVRPEPVLRRGRWVAGVCAALLVVHVLVAVAAVWGKSATYDEPLHFGGAWVRASRGDFRVNAEDPPLSQYWAAIPLLAGGGVNWPEHRRDLWDAMPQVMGGNGPWTNALLYQTPGNDADALLRRARVMMTLLSAALGALAAWWAWRLAGGVAAVATAAVFAFDPNFLAHGALVKNDVPSALAFVAVAFTVWRVGQRVTVARVLLAMAAVGVAVTVKFSGLIALAIAGVLLVVRAAMPVAWAVGRPGTVDQGSAGDGATAPSDVVGDKAERAVRSVGKRIAVASAVALALGVAAVVSIWAAYAFRYLPTTDSARLFDLDALVARSRRAELFYANGGTAATPEQLAAWRPGLVLRLARVADTYKLLPHGYVAGLMYTEATTHGRISYMRGKVRTGGWYAYFPYAMAVKTPTVTLLLAAGAAVVAVSTVRRWRGDQTWTAVCLTLLPGVYLLMAITSRFNLGLRHVLPVYPFVFIGVGLAVAWAVQRWGRRVGQGVAVLVAVGLVEVAAAFPNLIPFFNLPSGGPVAGLELLSDSNLDWGQDLTTLAAWRREHPEGRLYLAYFGMADPKYYGLEFDWMIGAPLGGGSQRTLTDAKGPGYVAVSATLLQGLYMPHSYYEPLRYVEPVAVLGESIYVYRLD